MNYAYQTQGFSDYQQTIDAGQILTITNDVATISAPIGQRSYLSMQVRAQPGDTVLIRFTARLKSGVDNTGPGALIQAALDTGVLSSNVEVTSTSYNEYECALRVPKQNTSFATVTVTVGSWTSVGGEIEVVGTPRIFLEGDYAVPLVFALGMVNSNNGAVSLSPNHARFGIESLLYDATNNQVLIQTSAPKYGNGHRAPFAIANQTLYNNPHIHPVADYDRTTGLITVKFIDNTGVFVSIATKDIFFTVMLVG